MTSAAEPVVLGVSLKLYFDPDRTAQWAGQVATIARRHVAVTDKAVELFVLPSAPMIAATVQALRGTGVRVGAQDLFWEDRGAITGGVSGADLRDLGCDYVEIGHAERRRIFGEDDAMIRRKLDAAFRNRLCPIICVGECEKGSAEVAAAESIAELAALLDNTTEDHSERRLLVAYEPEWAIGAEHAASAEHVRHVVATIRSWLNVHRGHERHAVLYGGSAGPGLLRELAGAADGLFLGRFVHDPRALEQVLDEVVTLK